MTIQGVNTFLCDPDIGAAITPQWCQLLTRAGIRAVRVVVRANTRTNTLRLDLAQRAAQCYRDAGIDVLAVLCLETDSPWLEGPVDRDFYPNQDLGYRGNLRQNRYIRELGYRAQEIAKALVPCGVMRYAMWNEPNLRGGIVPGANVPPATTDKAPALAPEVWGALLYEVAGYLRAGGATDIQAGSLSWIAGSGTDQHNPYCCGYLGRALAYLHASGVRQLPWSHLAVNAEGRWTGDAAGAMRNAISQTLRVEGFADLPLTVGEWGWPAGSALDTAQAQGTASALAAVCDHMYFFQGPTDAAGYGAHGWVVGGNGFVPTAERTGWWPVLQQVA